MGFDSLVHGVGLTLRVFLIDLLLSGDNAVVIALACRNLPSELMRRAMLFGTVGAIVLRVVLTTIAGLLLSLPLLKVAGGIALTAIAIKLVLDEEEDAAKTAGPVSEAVDLRSAVGTVIIADMVMGFDNVIALAAANDRGVDQSAGPGPDRSGPRPGRGVRSARESDHRSGASHDATPAANAEEKVCLRLDHPLRRGCRGIQGCELCFRTYRGCAWSFTGDGASSSR